MSSQVKPRIFYKTVAMAQFYYKSSTRINRARALKLYGGTPSYLHKVLRGETPPTIAMYNRVKKLMDALIQYDNNKPLNNNNETTAR